MKLVTAPIALPTALVRRPTDPSEIAPLALRQQPQGSRELHQPVELFRDDDPERFELRGDGRPGEPEHPAEESKTEQDGEEQAIRPRDREPAPDQARAAVEEHGEDGASDDEEQRLGEDDDPDDG